MNIVCVVFGVWCASAPYHMPDYTYDPGQRLVLPVESFGANWHVQNFRKKVPFPSNIEPALARAIAYRKTIGDGMPVTITFAPRMWHLKQLDFSQLSHYETTLDLGDASFHLP